jgi:4-amino-4-deoxy-L-arabinose transferase-like glycosyltransferase
MAVESAHKLILNSVGLRVSRHALLALLLLALALAPRVLVVGDFWTRDEPFHWLKRSESFLQAMQYSNYADTNLTGHPGVTTMWLGAAGLLLHQGMAHLGWIDPADSAVQRALLRLPLAVVTAMSIALAYLLLRRLFNARVALLAALFWAADPFLVAHSQVLHLDALLASFMTIALLAALTAFVEDRGQGTGNRGQRRNLYLALSAAAAGLAFLTKSPALLLLPLVGLIVLIGLVRTENRGLSTENRGLRTEHRGLSTENRELRNWFFVFRTWFFVLSFWFLIVVLLWVTLWPANWVDPTGALLSVINEVRDNGATVHETGNFFMGRAVDDPGPFFYPVALALRLTPWALLGLLPAGIALSRRGTARYAPGMLTLFAVLFVLALTMLSKKMDRYLLSIFPALNIIAAWGWIWALDWTRKRWNVSTVAHWNVGTLKRFAWLLVGLLLGVNLAWYHPYELAYYNPLLGGGPVAERTVLVGWGEGLDQVAAFIATDAADCTDRVAAWYWPLLLEEVCTPLAPLDQAIKSADADYAVTYINQIQRHSEPATMAVLHEMTPLHTVRIHGIDYARIYALPEPVAHTVGVDFGSDIHLQGYSLFADALQTSGAFTLTLQWQAHAPLAKDYLLFIHMLDSAGNLIAQVDVPPGGPDAPTSTWQPQRYITWTHTVPLPDDIPPGNYRITLGLYDPADFSRLPLHAPPPSTSPTAGTHALLLETLTVEP